MSSSASSLSGGHISNGGAIGEANYSAGEGDTPPVDCAESGGALDDGFRLAQMLARQEFEHLLESMVGVKELVVEGALMRPLDRLISMAVLKEHECPRVQQLHADRALRWSPDTEHGIFLARLTIPIAKKLCELIMATQQRHGLDQLRLSVVCVDGRKNFFERELERNGLHGTVQLHQFSFHFIALENDLLSLELPLPYTNTYCFQSAQLLARALWRLGEIYVTERSVSSVLFGAGEGARLIAQWLDRFRLEAKKAERKNAKENGIEAKPKKNQTLFDTVLLFDRSLDVPSVLLTGMTYESMLNDVFVYNCGKIVFGQKVEEKLANKQNKKAEKQKENVEKATKPLTSRAFPLSASTDSIFGVIRDLHMTSALPFLSQKAKTLQSTIDRASEINKVEEMKAFVSNELRSLRDQQRTLELHICAAEVLMEEFRGVSASERFSIEWALVRGDFDHSEVLMSLRKLMNGGIGSWTILKLGCLWSLRSGGLPQKFYRQFVEEFLRAMAKHSENDEFQHRIGVFALRRCGLLFPTQHSQPIAEALTKNLRSPLALASSRVSALPSIIGATGVAEKQSGEKKKVNAHLNLPSSMSNLSHSPATTNWGTVIKELKLCPSPTDKNPKVEKSAVAAFESRQPSPAFVFSDEYTPVVCRLLELALQEHRQRVITSLELEYKSKQKHKEKEQRNSFGGSDFGGPKRTLLGKILSPPFQIPNPAQKIADASSITSFSASSKAGSSAQSTSSSTCAAATMQGWDNDSLRQAFFGAGEKSNAKQNPNKSGGEQFSTKSSSSSVGGEVFSRFPNGGGEMPQTVLVCIVGGATYAEVAALRALARRERVRLVVATSAILNREQFLRQSAELFPFSF